MNPTAYSLNTNFYVKMKAAEPRQLARDLQVRGNLLPSAQRTVSQYAVDT